MRQKHILGVFTIIEYLQESSTYIFTHFLHRLSFLEVKKRNIIEMLFVFPTGDMRLYMLCLLCLWYIPFLWCFQPPAETQKNNVRCICATGGPLKLSIFFGQIIGNKTKKLQNRKLNSLPRTFFVCFRTLPCISSLMVRVTFSPPSDWTLMGSMSGLDVKEGAWSRERGVQGPTRVWWWSQPTGHLPDKRDKDTPAEIRPSTLCFSTLFWKFNVDIQLPGDTKAGFKPRNSNANTKNILFKFTLSLLKFFVVLE